MAKFKIGDRINLNGRDDKEWYILTITSINMDERCYVCNQGSVISFDEEDGWHVVGKPTSNRGFVFKSLPRILEMVKVSDRAITYCGMLADTLDKEGYSIDAKIVREHVRMMRGEKVAMATMDEV